MDLHQLYVFTKVVEHKSFSKAAEDIFLSQSTVSSHIQALERTLDTKLFDRIGREPVLTPQGERLYQWALKLLLLKDQAIFDLKQGMTELKGMVRIAASSVPGQFIIPKMVKQFREQYPSAIFHIDQSSSKNAVDKVLNGTVDLGIIGEKFESEKLKYIPLIEEKLVLITSNKTKLPDSVNISDILDYPFIMRNSDSGTNAMLEKLLRKNQIKKEQMNIIAYTDSSQSLMQFVMEDIGISIVSEIAAKSYSELNMLHMYHINGFDEKRFFYLVYNTEKTHSMIAKFFIDTAADVI
ncbi:selenium metabolism-associated LysR family transcriptional regulator [Neobacillus dielmonensis]|uniref:selenium metabolism-associated LysR family transcriptional regulator n=1 Tax=Neobacillus dielmonensis TaxID=1347369 RepID=UPI0005AA680A|nr:selenium metabolism-associated LysR family transcriptional regulator [Neobacillus dielmonensis]